MKIANAQVSMLSEHVAVTTQAVRTSMRAWIGPRPAGSEARRQDHPSVQISTAGRAAQAAEQQAAQRSSDPTDSDPRLALLRAMIERLTGHRIRVFDAGALQTEPPPSAASPSAQTTTATPADPGFGLEFDYHEVRSELEQTGFSAQGVVKTADGQTIGFQLDLTMARDYVERTDLSLRAGNTQAKDPLVINFDGNAAQLVDQRFSFDLNGDGSAEALPILAAGSGYLALDRNGNGSIDSGAELFGPATGSGFAELAALDSDHNNWIDQNDPAYAQLRVWTPDASGGGTIATLAEKQVGAVDLGNLATPFALKGTGNTQLGAVAATGLYLKEDGGAGTVQEVDLTI